jgi:hypothetical protein
VTVAWNNHPGARTAPIEAASGAATVYGLDAAGKVVTQRLAASGGTFNVALPGITNHNGIGGRAIMGGQPVIVVEGGSAAVAAVAAGPATSGSAGPATGGSAGSGSASGAAAMRPAADPPDRSPPILAVVAPLPASSPPKFDLKVLSGDEGSGLDAFVVHFATGAMPPKSTKDWSPLGTVRPWPGRPKAGQISLPFEGKPGQTYYFAAQAGDGAGNWTVLPAYAQAATRIAVGAGGAAPASGPRSRQTGPR